MILSHHALPKVLETDVCIVGGGLVGLYAAIALRSMGRRVVVLERGGLEAVSSSDSNVNFAEDRYEGAASGRAIGLGGTSTLWGGQLAAMAPHELSVPLDGQSEPWPLTYDELESSYRRVFQRFCLQSGVYEQVSRCSSNPGTLDFKPGHAYSLKTSARNLARAWSSQLKQDLDLKIVLNSQVNGIPQSVSDGITHAEGVFFSTDEDTVRSVASSHIIIASGALESTALVQRHFPPVEMGPKCFEEGTTLQDHVSIPIARIKVRDLEMFRALFSPRLALGGVLFQRLFSSSVLEQSLSVPGGFLHVVYTAEGSLPLWIHELLTFRQQGNWPAFLRKLPSGFAHAKAASALAKGVVRRRRIEWPADAAFTLLLDIEQLPDRRNWIKAGTSKTGLNISWRVRERDLIAQNVLRQRIVDSWDSTPAGEAAELINIDSADNLQPRKIAFHPTGTLRMGSSASAGSVDKDCRLHRCINVSVLSTAVFPRCGAGNPSLTLLALGERLASHLSHKA